MSNQNGRKTIAQALGMAKIDDKFIPLSSSVIFELTGEKLTTATIEKEKLRKESYIDGDDRYKGYVQSTTEDIKISKYKDKDEYLKTLKGIEGFVLDKTEPNNLLTDALEDATQVAIDGIKKQSEDSMLKISELEEKINKTREELLTQMITIFGVFSSIISIITVNINVFQYMDKFKDNITYIILVIVATNVSILTIICIMFLMIKLFFLSSKKSTKLP